MLTVPSFADYIDMFRRRKMLLFLVFAMIFGGSVAAAMWLPAEYESTASIRIDRHHVPANLIQSTVVVGYVNEHLSNLGQAVMSTSSLWELAEQLDVYPELREAGARGELAATIRRKTRREILYVDVGEEEMRRNAAVAVAFTITHASADPETAMKVANGIAERYLEESDRARAEQAARLTRFLRTRTQELEQKISEHEDALEAFKTANASSLPQFVQFNMNRLEAIQDQIDRISEGINGLTQLRIGLEAQLSQIEPRMNVLAGDRRQLTPSNQVERLRLEYLTMAGSYAPRHPSFARLRNELQALVGQSDGASALLRLIQGAEADRTRLFEARADPDVDPAQIAALERAVGANRDRLNNFNRSADGETVQADNPAYIAAVSRLRSVESDIASEMARREALQRRVTEFDTRVVSSPTVEREFQVLTRNHEQILREYEETRNKLLQAEAAERIESGQIGDRFTLTGKAAMPSEPARPMRAGIAALGFIFAAGTSTGIAALVEYFDKTVRGARGVLAVWGAPPLAAIPVYLTRRERRNRMLRAGLGWLLVVALIVAATWYGFAEGFLAWPEDVSS